MRFIILSFATFFFSSTFAWAEEKILTPPVLSAAECEKAYTDSEFQRMAAEAGDAFEQSNLANDYFSHGNYVEAAKWYKKAAEGGAYFAQSVLGEAYAPDFIEKYPYGHQAKKVAIALHEGKAIASDYAESVKWFRKAADQGVDDAQRLLGLLYRDGNGVKQDYTEAYFWMRLAHYDSERHQSSDAHHHYFQIGHERTYDKGQAAEEIKKQLTQEQIQNLENRVKEWKSPLFPDGPSHSTANVLGILCGKSYPIWSIIDEGDFFYITIPNTGNGGGYKFNKRTKEIVFIHGAEL